MNVNFMSSRVLLAFATLLQTSLILGIPRDAGAGTAALKLARRERRTQHILIEGRASQVSAWTTDAGHRRSYDYAKLEGFQDSDCSELIERSGYIIAGGTDIQDGSCVNVAPMDSQYDALLQNRSMVLGLMVECPSGDAKLQAVRLGIVFGVNCTGGFDDSTTVMLGLDQAAKFGRGECASAMNMDQNQAYWMQLKHIENINSVPSCLLPTGDTMNWKLIGAIGGAVGVVVLCVMGFGLHLTRKKKKKKDPAPDSMAQSSPGGSANAEDDTPRGSLLLDSGDDMPAPRLAAPRFSDDISAPSKLGSPRSSNGGYGDF